jgi:hypothetical protein
VSCGDGDEEGAPPPPAEQPLTEVPVATATVEVAAGDLTPADLVARLPALIITAEDVPAGFDPAQSAEVPNEMVAAADPLPEQRLQELEEMGRVGGHQIIFLAEQGVIAAVLSVYDTTEGAQQGLDMGVRFTPDVVATAVDAPDVGLPAVAWEIEESTGSGLKGYLMLARKGRIDVALTYGEVRGADRAGVEALLRAQIAKLGELE